MDYEEFSAFVPSSDNPHMTVLWKENQIAGQSFIPRYGAAIMMLIICTSPTSDYIVTFADIVEHPIDKAAAIDIAAQRDGRLFGLCDRLRLGRVIPEGQRGLFEACADKIHNAAERMTAAVIAEQTGALRRKHRLIRCQGCLCADGLHAADLEHGFIRIRDDADDRPFAGRQRCGCFDLRDLIVVAQDERRPAAAVFRCQRDGALCIAEAE